MTRRRTHATIARRSTELALAVPQVVAHRMTRMALAGPFPNARDRRKFQGMAHEKVLAFWQSWFAMGWAMVQSMQKTWMAALQGVRLPLIDSQALLGHALGPVHKHATANARRLARTRLR